ncbi:MAG: SulP family inorganic anion transporter, partial [Planctomycetaceae bacterium]
MNQDRVEIVPGSLPPLLRGPGQLPDLLAGVSVSLVTAPICVGIAQAAGAPPIAGILSGVIGGIVVGLVSRSACGVTGPAAGLQAVVVSQLAILGSYESLLTALIVAGLLQVALSLIRVGALSAFLPISVVRGMLAAIGLVLILKQIPHVLGHDTDPEGEMSFQQPDQETTFTEFLALLDDMHPGAAAIGVSSIVLLILWDRWQAKHRSWFPAPLLVLPLGVLANYWFGTLGDPWEVEATHLVNFPITGSLSELAAQVSLPDLRQWPRPAVWSAGATIGGVASLETLLNLRAVDKLDPQQRRSPPNRELLAQGIGNTIAGLMGGLPMTSVVAHGALNIDSGSRTRWAAVAQGMMLLGGLTLFPAALDLVPMASIAAVLVVVGLRLFGLGVVWRMWNEDRSQSIPFLATVLGILFSDLLIGTLLGLSIAVGFILNSNLRRPVRRCVEKHLDTNVLHVELANQVSFLNRATIEDVLRGVPRGEHVLLDATNTDYVDA